MREILVFDFRRGQVSVVGDPKAERAIADVLAAQQRAVKVGSSSQTTATPPPAGR